MQKILLSIFVAISLGCSHQLVATPVSDNFVVREKLTQGGYLLGKVAPNTQVTLDEDIVRVTEEGYFFIGFNRDAPPKVVLSIKQPKGELVSHSLEIKQRTYDIQRIEGVPQRTVSPSQTDLDRIAKESALIKKARQQHSDRLDFINEFQWPLTGRISGVYGSQRVYNGEPRRPHFGVDVARPAGTLVRAPNSGKVSLVHQNMFFSGGTLVIDHGFGISSTFIHLSEVLVKEGDIVKTGDHIAKVGATGRATGPHLDWRINWFNVRLDPALFVGEMLVQKKN